MWSTLHSMATAGARRRASSLASLLFVSCGGAEAHDVVWPAAPDLVFALVLESGAFDIRGPKMLPLSTSVPAEAELYLAGVDSKRIVARHPRYAAGSARIAYRPIEAPECPGGRFGASSLSVPLVEVAEIHRVEADGSLRPVASDDPRFAALDLEFRLDEATCPIPPGPGVLIADISGHAPLSAANPEELNSIDHLDEDHFLLSSESHLFVVARGERGIPRRVFVLDDFAEPPEPAWAVKHVQVAHFPSGPARIFVAMNRFAGGGLVSESALIQLVSDGEELRVVGRRSDLPRLESFFVDPSRGLLVAAAESVFVGTSTGGPLIETPFAHGQGPNFARFTGDETAPHVVVGRDWVWRGRLDGSPTQIQTLASNADSNAVGLEASEDGGSIVFASSREHFSFWKGRWESTSWLVAGTNLCPALIQGPCGRWSPMITTLTSLSPSSGDRLALSYTECRSAVFVDPSADCVSMNSLAEAQGEIHGLSRWMGRFVAVSESGRILEFEDAR